MAVYDANAKNPVTGVQLAGLPIAALVCIAASGTFQIEFIDNAGLTISTKTLAASGAAQKITEGSGVNPPSNAVGMVVSCDQPFLFNTSGALVNSSGNYDDNNTLVTPTARLCPVGSYVAIGPVA